MSDNEVVEHDCTTLNISAQDVLAAIGFEAQRIVHAVNQHAAGYPFPNPNELQLVIDHVVQLNHVLTNYSQVLFPSPTLTATSAMSVELT